MRTYQMALFSDCGNVHVVGRLVETGHKTVAVKLAKQVDRPEYKKWIESLDYDKVSESLEIYPEKLVVEVGDHVGTADLMVYDAEVMLSELKDVMEKDHSCDECGKLKRNECKLYKTYMAVKNG